jgi:hypothetical protein
MLLEADLIAKRATLRWLACSTPPTVDPSRTGCDALDVTLLGE